ncbi:MAG: DUF1922 domain-containing protein [Methanobacteriota archaeon]|nr:MAG: DUF1922 domain-containing protein [Euryarchaeota archaeon]
MGSKTYLTAFSPWGIVWFVIQCSRYECAKFLVTKGGTKTRKCPYCRRVNKVTDRLIARFQTQEEAREYAKKKNMIVP